MVTDDVGREVVLARPAEKIIALSPHIVENLFSAGAGKKIIAAVEFSDFPREAKNIQQVGRFDTISIEKILALTPDLVVVWGSGGGLKLINKLEELDLTVYVDEPSTLDSIANSIRNLAILAGTEKVGEVAANDFSRELTQLKRLGSEKQPSVFYQLWGSPIQTVNGKHVISDAISHCGGKNIFSEVQSIAPKVNIESVLSKSPDIIIASGTDENRPLWLEDWDTWQALPAVEFSRVYHIPPDIIQRHTLRILDGVKMMCDYIQQSLE
ncbi:MAG: cobalamin-binding protein [Cellvibrionaceae bacterium]